MADASETSTPLSRALLAAAAMAACWALLAWVPASTAELWPARAGDLSHALPAALVVMAASLVGGFAARMHRAAAAAALVVLAATLCGWPLLRSTVELGDHVASEPLHALAAVAAALGGLSLAALPVRLGRLRPVGPLACGAVLVLAAVAPSGLERDLPEMEGEEVVMALLETPELWDVRRENPRRPVALGSFAAGEVTQFDAGTLPLLELVPPAEVRVRVPATSEGAVLRLAGGIAADSYAADERTRVRLEAAFEGEPFLEVETSNHDRLPAKRRVWHRAEVPVGGGGTLVLRTHYDGPAAARPRAGFALLEVVRPLRVRRTLPSTREPSAILVLIDTLRADRLSAYGNPREASPGLDALAARGTLFETAFSSASWTWPSTASVLTSLTPPEHGVLDQSACYLAEGLVSVAEVFQAAGVSTAAFSSNPLVSADKNFDKGFETFREYRWEPAGVVLEDATAWLERMGGYRFFLYLHLIDPHGPYEPEPDLEQAFGTPRPPGFSLQDHSQMVTRLRRSEPVDEARLRRNTAYLSSLYDGEVATADRALARFLERLAELGLDDRTVVAVTSDHGEEFLEHGMLGHGRQIYEESVRVPLILSGPGVPRGVRVETPVENRFLAPTLLALCGLEPRANLAGRPDLLDGGELELAADEPIFFASDLGWWPGHGARPLRGVRTDGRFLVYSPGGEGADALVRLFDLERDPRAKTDVAPERPTEVARLTGLVEDWLERAAAVRPSGFSGGEEVREMLQELGYIGD